MNKLNYSKRGGVWRDRCENEKVKNFRKRTDLGVKNKRGGDFSVIYFLFFFSFCCSFFFLSASSLSWMLGSFLSTMGSGNWNWSVWNWKTGKKQKFFAKLLTSVLIELDALEHGVIFALGHHLPTVLRFAELEVIGDVEKELQVHAATWHVLRMHHLYNMLQGAVEDEAVFLEKRLQTA